MKLVNEFTVAVPLERAWETLLDIERVASFLPGATIEPTGEEGVFHGRMRVKLGPMVIHYEGTARMLEVDETQHIARMSVQAKEAKGQGTASAIIVNQALAVDGGTRVVAETELAITGRQAQFGRGIMQDVAGRMLGEFAKRFEAHLLGADEPVAAAAAVEPAAPVAARTATDDGRPAPSAVPGDEETLDLGNVLSQTPLVRVGGAAGAAVLVLALVAVRRRRSRRGLSFGVRYSG
jgi:hypothetical protein